VIKLLGYIFSIAGLYGLYINEIPFGGLLFFVGGFVAGTIKLRLRGIGVMLIVVPTAYGYHNEFTLLVVGLIVVGVLLACTGKGRNYDGGEWGIDLGGIDFSSGGDGCDGGGD